MNNTQPTHLRTPSVLSVDIAREDETADTDTKTNEVGSPAIRKSLEAMAIGLPSPSPRLEHCVAERSDITIKLEQGICDDPVKAYLKSKGWEDIELLRLQVDLSIRESNLMGSDSPKEFLCSRLLHEAIEKKSLDVFKVIPKNPEQLPDLLVQLNQKITDEPDCEIYKEMRTAAMVRRRPTHLEKILGM